MTKKVTTILAMSLLLMAGILTRVQPASAQSGNLLANPGFEGGHYNQDGLAEITVPNGWRMHWLDGVSFSDSYNGLVAHRPETVVWNAIGGIPAGEEMLWRDGTYTLKIFKSWAPMYAALSQDVTGLQVGRRYQLVVPVFTDIYDWDGRKVFPSDTSHGQVRLGASPVGAAWRDAGAIAYSGWFAATYGDYGIFAYEFTATQPEMTVWVEVKATYPHENNGFFMDALGLYALQATAPVPNPGGSAPAPSAPSAPSAPVAPLPTPEPPTPRADGSVVHVVQSGDSLWTIAIRYAGVMGLAPQEALARLQELNNNPEFINVGQELLIMPASATPPTPTPEAESGAETSALRFSASAAVTETTGEEGEEATPEPTAEPEQQGATLCLSAFRDDNSDGVLNQGAESLLANAALTIARANETVVTAVTDGVTPEQCFSGLMPDTYQVRFYPPANFRASTEDSWVVTLTEGMQVSVSFGALVNEEVVEVAAVSQAIEPIAEMASGSTAMVPALEVSESGTAVGPIVIGLAVFLVVLAAVGIVLLRRA